MGPLAKLAIGMMTGGATQPAPPMVGYKPPKPAGPTPEQRLQQTQDVGNVGEFNQKTEGVQLQKFKPMSMSAKTAALSEEDKRLIRSTLIGAGVGVPIGVGLMSRHPNPNRLVGALAGASAGAGLGAFTGNAVNAWKEPVKLGIGAPIGGSSYGAGPPPLGGTPGQKKLVGKYKDPRTGRVASLYSSGPRGASEMQNRINAMGLQKIGFQTSEYSGPLSEGRFMARHPLAMGGAPMMRSGPSLTESIKSAGPPPPGEEESMNQPQTVKKGSLALSARNALEAVGEWQQKQAAALTPAGKLTAGQRVGAPKTTAPPGPSIAQISKPVGFGRPLAGATKSAALSKLGLLAEAVRLGLKDIPGTPRLFMKSRTPQEREALSRLVRKKYNRRVTQPIMNVAEKGISKIPAGKVQNATREMVKMVAQDPLGQGAAHFIPIPGASFAYEGGKRGLSGLINKVDVPASRIARASI